MSRPHLPLEQLGTTKREQALLARVGVALAAFLAGAGIGVGGYAWASTRIATVSKEVAAVSVQVGVVDAKVEAHLAYVRARIPTMEGANAKLDLLIEDCYRRGGCRQK